MGLLWWQQWQRRRYRLVARHPRQGLREPLAKAQAVLLALASREAVVQALECWCPSWPLLVWMLVLEESGLQQSLPL